MSSAVPSEAIQIVKEFEGCEKFVPSDGLIHAYPDPASGGEPYTIGWGTTIYSNGTKVKLGDKITRADADNHLAANLLRSYWTPLEKSIPYWNEMNDKMRSALCSFAYNLGAGFYGSSDFKTISACLKEKRWSDVPKALMLYVNPGSSVEAGLRRRRDAEGDLWQAGMNELSGAAPDAKPVILEAITATFLKKDNLDSSKLPPQQLIAINRGRQWKIEKRLETAGNSQQVELAYGAGDWWIYLPHWKEVSGTQAPTPTSATQPTPTAASPAVATGADIARQAAGTTGPKNLNVPYLKQLDNKNNPYGSCNVTCVAMCLQFFGVKPPPGKQLEDVLYEKMESLGRSRHNPYDLQYLINTYPGNFKDIFREDGGFRDIQASIDAGHPVIIHGYFTSFGHIIVVRGYDDKGFIVNDPYGEWFSTGYDNSRTGANLHYSYNMIANTCSPESKANPKNIWFHSVLKA
ncbi:MAG: C39 family peptidase [Synechococcaceae cyanobacterium]|jgi:GH24 family phage-related lysozyme (muramidase)/uncharacterized protein YvpB